VVKGKDQLYGGGQAIEKKHRIRKW
jgi:hypothetical protein